MSSQDLPDGGISVLFDTYPHLWGTHCESYTLLPAPKLRPCNNSRAVIVALNEPIHDQLRQTTGVPGSISPRCVRREGVRAFRFVFGLRVWLGLWFGLTGLGLGLWFGLPGLGFWLGLGCGLTGLGIGLWLRSG
jgi:hypothetical protein